MRNLTMMTDLYQLTMMNGYLHHGMQNSRACFDLFYRRQGEMTAYTLAAGLEQAIEYINNDELVEVTPENIRLRKAILDRTIRGRNAKNARK